MRRRSILVALAAVSLSAACAQPKTVVRPRGQFPPKARPTPPECADAVERAKRLANELELEMVVGASARRVAIQAGLLPAEGGFASVTTRAGESQWVVHFVAERDGGLVEPFDVTLTAEPTLSSNVTRFEPPKAPEPDVARLFAARRAAAREPFVNCSRTYGVVLLPADRIGEQGTLVYLLAVQGSDAWMLGADVRRVVDVAGRVVRTDRMSDGCLEVPILPDAEAALAVTPRWACPTELQVWQALANRKPLVVRNQTGVWVIVNDDVRFAGTCEERTWLNAAVCPRDSP